MPCLFTGKTEEYCKSVLGFWFAEGFLKIFADLHVKERKEEQCVKMCSYVKGVEYRSNTRVKISSCICGMTVHC